MGRKIIIVDIIFICSSIGKNAKTNKEKRNFIAIGNFRQRLGKKSLINDILKFYIKIGNLIK